MRGSSPLDTRTLRVGPTTTSTAHRLPNYDGLCSNVHGHNIEWKIELLVSMEGAGEANMPLDFKEVDDILDETDHAVLLSREDRLVERFGGDLAEVEEVLGDVIWFEGDPTCELVSQWMAERLAGEIDPVLRAEVQMAETDKYAVNTATDGSVPDQHQESLPVEEDDGS